MPRLALAAVAVAAAFAAAWLWPTDARRIRATLETAVSAVSAAAGERELERVARAASLAKALAPDVVVETGPDGPSVQGREMVVGLASRVGMAGPLVSSSTASSSPSTARPAGRRPRRSPASTARPPARPVPMTARRSASSSPGSAARG